MPDSELWAVFLGRSGITGGTRTGTTIGGPPGPLVPYGHQYDAMGNPGERAEDAGVSNYTDNDLNPLATGDWTGVRPMRR